MINTKIYIKIQGFAKAKGNHLSMNKHFTTKSMTKEQYKAFMNEKKRNEERIQDFMSDEMEYQEIDKIIEENN